MKKNDGGPAFPMEYSTFEYEGDPAYNKKTRIYHRQKGSSLRDYFAAKALLGLLGMNSEMDDTMYGIAINAYKIADAMLMEREK